MRLPLMAALTALLGLSLSLAQTAAPTPRPLPAPNPPATVTATRNEPVAQEFTPDKLSRLRVPAGFEIKVMASGLGNARMLHVMPDGGLYLSRMKQNDIWYLRDVNGDGQFGVGERKQVASNLSLVHGMDDRGGKLYAIGEHDIWVMDMARDGTLSAPRVFVSDLPDVGQHSARGLVWGPDGFLYASIGSTNNDSRTPNPEEATMLRIAPDGKTREVYARGLRHTIGFGFQPGTGVLYGADQGSDWHGDNIPPEEINVISRSQDYGWPYCYGDRQVDPYVNASNVPGLITKEAFCQRTQGSVLNHTAHAAAIGMTFYQGQAFPAEYRNDAFVAYRGSWNRSEPSGYEIGRVEFDTGNKPVAVTPFVSGFVYQENGEWKQFGRVAGVATYTDGSLLFTDDQSGVIYRVRFTGGQG